MLVVICRQTYVPVEVEGKSVMIAVPTPEAIKVANDMLSLDLTKYSEQVLKDVLSPGNFRDQLTAFAAGNINHLTGRPNPLRLQWDLFVYMAEYAYILVTQQIVESLHSVSSSLFSVAPNVDLKYMSGHTRHVRPPEMLTTCSEMSIGEFNDLNMRKGAPTQHLHIHKRELTPLTDAEAVLYRVRHKVSCAGFIVVYSHCCSHFIENVLN